MQQKILLVDDREDNLLSIETILAPAGYTFVKALSGREALKVLLNEFDFALILMDVKMPNLNGFETASLIYQREKLRHIPIIFITANNYGEEHMFKGYMTGAVDYIYKPINPDLLRAKVSVFIDLYKKNHRLLAQEQKLVAINKNLELEIHERKVSEEKVKELNHKLLENIERLESANRDLDRFAFMASHDLQEPLRKMLMFSDRLGHKYKDVLDEEGKMFISRIQHAGERMQALIKDILLFSKTSIEKPTFVDTDLNGILTDVLVEMEHIIHEKNVRIESEKLPNLSINPVLIRPLFHNLISNAIKYAKKNVPPVVKIYSEFSAGQNGVDQNEVKSKYCRIYVEDNGIGFDQKYSEQIFGMFKRLHLHSEFEGTGIGLALCKKIVEEHHGFITARSKINEGSIFIISLPMQQPAGQMSAPITQLH
ncbi:MAG: response regulator [Chitinophagaceae bacterium]|nr:response regulator [Chitinophagaceae bacterium]